MQVSGKLKTQLTDIRKKANIAYRKATSEGVEKPTKEERPGPSKKPRLAAHTQSQEALEREDFEVICQYFANGGGDDDDDERVWANLSRHVSYDLHFSSPLDSHFISGTLQKCKVLAGVLYGSPERSLCTHRGTCTFIQLGEQTMTST